MYLGVVSPTSHRGEHSLFSPFLSLSFSPTFFLLLRPLVSIHITSPDYLPLFLFSNLLFPAHWLSLYRYTDASRFIPGNCLLNSRAMRQQPEAPRVTPPLTHHHFSIHLKVCTGPEGKRPTELFSRYRENMP